MPLMLHKLKRQLAKLTQTRKMREPLHQTMQI